MSARTVYGDRLSELLGKVAASGKHRCLLSVRDDTGFEIYFAEITNHEEFEDCFIYPTEEGHAIFARPKEPRLLLNENYDAMQVLKSMIEHVADIIRVPRPFFDGPPL